MSGSNLESISLIGNMAPASTSGLLIFGEELIWLLLLLINLRLDELLLTPLSLLLSPVKYANKVFEELFLFNVEKDECLLYGATTVAWLTDNSSELYWFSSSLYPSWSLFLPPAPPKQQQQYNMAPTIPTTTIPTAVKVPATFPLSSKNVSLLLAAVGDELGADRVGAVDAS